MGLVSERSVDPVRCGAPVPTLVGAIDTVAGARKVDFLKHLAMAWCSLIENEW